jgi:hypothetical protein
MERHNNTKGRVLLQVVWTVLSYGDFGPGVANAAVMAALATRGAARGALFLRPWPWAYPAGRTHLRPIFHVDCMWGNGNRTARLAPV